jgi:hypothetical protein
MGATSPYHVCSNKPAFEDLVTPVNLERLKGLKINSLSGSNNAVWKPQSTKQSYDMLRERFPDGEYERVVVPGYGQLDSLDGERCV